MCPFLPIPLHFQIASAASDYVYIIHILIKRVQTLSFEGAQKEQCMASILPLCQEALTKRYHHG